ncbi:MAG: type II secretion system F family protein [Acidiphilium sp.]|jgi:tight adherence protein B
MSHHAEIFLGLMIPLVLLILVAGRWSVKQFDHDHHFQGRIRAATDITENANVIDADDVSLQRKVDKTKYFRDLGDKFLQIDPYQSRYYRLNWLLTLILLLIVTVIVVYFSIILFGHRLILTFIGGPIMFWLMCRTIFGVMNQSRRGKLFEQFPDTIDAVVRSVRVGIPVVEALRVVVRDTHEPTRTEFARLADLLAVGVPMDEAIRQIADDNKIAEYGFFAAAIGLQAKSGGSIATTLETLSSVIRRRVAIRQRGFALTSEARTSATVLTLLPVLATVGLLFLSPSYAKKLFFTDYGHRSLAIALILLVLGQAVMRWMIRGTLNSVR